MYDFFEEKGVTRVRENECWSYLLEDEDKFSKSGYKSAQLQLKDCMLKCAVIRFDGQLKFIYFTENYKSLVEVLGTIPSHRVWNVFQKILESIIKVKNYGYLACENIDISPRNIYIDPATFETHLIYVPLVSENSHVGQKNFETSLRRNFLAALRESNNAMLAERESKLLDIFNYAGQSMEEMLQAMFQQAGGSAAPIKKNDSLCLVCNDKRKSFHYVMQKEKILIGRGGASESDISFVGSNVVSRKHCSIFKRNGKYYITDEGSTYGTAVNKETCGKGQEIELQDGDVIRLASTLQKEYQFMIKVQMK